MKKPILFFAGLTLITATSSLAAEIPGAQRTLNGSEVRISLGTGYSGATLRISGPNGFFVQSFSKHGLVSINLIKAGATANGIYDYEVTAASSETMTIKTPMDNGRGGVDRAVQKVPVSLTGSFYAEGGLIIDKSGLKEE